MSAQEPLKIDSLKQILQLENVKDTTKVSANYLLGIEYLSFDINESKLYAKKALNLSLKNKRYTLTEIYSLLGLLEYEVGKNDSARYYYDKALSELDTYEGNNSVRAVIYGNYSSTYEDTNNYEKQLEYSLKAINLSKEDPKELCFLYFNHSVIYEDAGFHAEGLQYLNLAHKISKEVKDLRIEAYSIRNLGHFAIENNDFETAKDYLNRGLEICSELNSIEICYHIHFAFGRLLIELGEFEEAEISILQAKKLAETRKLNQDVIESSILLGELEFRRGQFKKSSQIFREVNFNPDDIKDIRVAAMAFKSWSKAESEIGNFKKSNELMANYVGVSDSLHLSINKNLLANADRKYQTEKKNKEIIVQQLQLRESESELQKKNSESNYMIGIIIFLLVASILTWFLYQQKEKRKNQELLTLKREYQIKTLESLIEGEEKERFRIAKELHDGVNGDLSAIKYKLSSLLEMNNKVIKEAITMIDDSCKQVRAISHNLVPPSLESFNLIEATEVYCNNLNNVTSNVSILFQHIGDSVSITKKAEVNAFRVIQELVTNGIKHAEAKNINVQISCRDNTIQITVEDDGIGFDKNEITSDGIGLNNVQSRLDYLNASLDFVSNEKGTSYTIDIDKDQLNDN